MKRIPAVKTIKIFRPDLSHEEIGRVVIRVWSNLKADRPDMFSDDDLIKRHDMFFELVMNRLPKQIVPLQPDRLQLVLISEAVNQILRILTEGKDE